MPTPRQNRSLEAVAAARERLYTSDADPRKVVESLQRASRELDRHDIDTERMDRHLERHRELADDDGFTPAERRDCLETLRQLHRDLRTVFETNPTPRCLTCATALPSDADRDLCHECRDGRDEPAKSAGDHGESDSGDATDDVEKTVIDIDDSSQININSDNSSNETYDN